MSIRQVLATLTAQAQDVDTGLVARAKAIAAAEGWPAGHLVETVTFIPYRTSANLQLAGAANFAFLPLTASQELRAVKAALRKGAHRIQAEFEVFGLGEQKLLDNIAAYAEAAVQLLEDADQWSRDHAGTIESVEESVALSFGDFAGSPTTAGFTAVTTVLERSSQ